VLNIRPASGGNPSGHQPAIATGRSVVAQAPDLRHPAELCDFEDWAAVEAHLFDAFIPAAYRPPSGGRWTASQAEGWLVFLARHLEQTIRSSDLAWWQLQKAVPRIAAGLLLGLTVGLAFGLAAGLTVGLGSGLGGFGLRAGLQAGLVAGLGCGLLLGCSQGKPRTRHEALGEG
jgi:hypothetical protein